MFQSLLGGNKRTKFTEGDSDLIFHKLSACNEQTPLTSIEMTKEKVYGQALRSYLRR